MYKRQATDGVNEVADAFADSHPAHVFDGAVGVDVRVFLHALASAVGANCQCAFQQQAQDQEKING